MTTSHASPRHPWKALAAVVAMFALVHGAGAHVFMSDHEHGGTHVHVIADHAVDLDDDTGPDIDIDIDDPDPETGALVDITGPHALDRAFDHDFD